MIVMRDSLLKPEHSLLANGQKHAVMDMRRRFQGAMRDDLIAAVTEHTGRAVDAFLSDNTVDPDIAVEVFILEPQDGR
jgi:uncharacterized protein YbcI